MTQPNSTAQLFSVTRSHVNAEYAWSMGDEARREIRRELNRVERDLRRHLDAISGEDGCLAEHGKCVICEATQ